RPGKTALTAQVTLLGSVVPRGAPQCAPGVSVAFTQDLIPRLVIMALDCRQDPKAVRRSLLSSDSEI
ncbi:hypothetical protein, partial [Thiomonas sp.]|uniref:hypothetical protein n=1 Tax=Thiomonas sp. TaxID=2047785 RepID=UPI002623E807